MEGFKPIFAMVWFRLGWMHSNCHEEEVQGKAECWDPDKTEYYSYFDLINQILKIGGQVGFNLNLKPGYIFIYLFITIFLEWSMCPWKRSREGKYDCKSVL